ncbi:MAG: hypothetical protein LWX83_16630, partial [Anaerolineae bacterium]|nr:hypothetical protein [Anaerolineae bacterium]
MKKFLNIVACIILGFSIVYSLLVHFFDLFQLELLTRLWFLLIGSVLMTGAVIYFWSKKGDKIVTGLKTNSRLTTFALALSVLTVVFIWIRGFNQVMPLPSNHMLTLRWDESSPNLLPVRIKDMTLSYGATIFNSEVLVGGNYGFEDGMLVLTGPENKLVFSSDKEDGIKITFDSLPENLTALWDGLPVKINTQQGLMELNLPDYKWGNSVWFKKLFFMTGAVTDSLVEILVLFILYTSLLFSLTAEKEQSRLKKWTLRLVPWFFFLIMLNRAWLCDDAYITFRTVDNFVNGYGLTWNVIDRVQAYTHPLWMFLISLVYFFTREIYFTSLIVSLSLSFAAVYILYKKLASAQITAIFAVLVLSFSNAFVDYSTSGLENPLSYILLVLFLWMYLTYQGKQRVLILSLLASLAILNRVDTGAFYFFPLLYELIKQRSIKAWAWAILGQVPFLLWEIFSIIYYGFPFPNTAYAKLNAGINHAQYYQWALNYYQFTFEHDPITFLGIIGGLISACLLKDWRERMIALGIPVYLLYIIYIGGDFMGGRYFTLPLLCAMVLFSRLNVPDLKLPYAAVALAMMGWAALSATYATPIAHNIFNINAAKFNAGVADERLYYGRNSGLVYLKDRLFERILLENPQELKWPSFPWRFEGERMKISAQNGQQNVFITGAIGYKGYYAGPKVFIIDYFTLSDPLLARLPVISHTEWRVGHLTRTVPLGYLESIETGQNRFIDPKLAEFYGKLTLITRGDLFSAERLKTIWEMNLGNYDQLIDADYYRQQQRAEKFLPEKYWKD